MTRDRSSYQPSYDRSLENSNKTFYDSFSWIYFNCLRNAESVHGDSVLLTTNFLELPGIHLIQLRRMKVWLAREDTYSGPNLDLFCVRQLDAALFYENYAELHFDAKSLEKGFKRCDKIFVFFFFNSMIFLAIIRRCANF